MAGHYMYTEVSYYINFTGSKPLLLKNSTFTVQFSKISRLQRIMLFLAVQITVRKNGVSWIIEKYLGNLWRCQKKPRQCQGKILPDALKPSIVIYKKPLKCRPAELTKYPLSQYQEVVGLPGLEFWPRLPSQTC